MQHDVKTKWKVKTQSLGSYNAGYNNLNEGAAKCFWLVEIKRIKDEKKMIIQEKKENITNILL